MQLFFRGVGKKDRELTRFDFVLCEFRWPIDAFQMIVHNESVIHFVFRATFTLTMTIHLMISPLLNFQWISLKRFHSFFIKGMFQWLPWEYYHLQYLESNLFQFNVDILCHVRS